MNRNRIAALAAGFVVAASMAAAQGRGGGRGANAQQAAPAAAPATPGAQTPRLPPPEEKTSVTHNKATIGGQSITYTATTGNLVVKDDAGNPKASFFYVAYTKDDVTDRNKRPLSFVYNGGPGSASSFTPHGSGSEARCPLAGWPRAWSGALRD